MLTKCLQATTRQKSLISGTTKLFCHWNTVKHSPNGSARQCLFRFIEDVGVGRILLSGTRCVQGSRNIRQQRENLSLMHLDPKPYVVPSQASGVGWGGGRGSRQWGRGKVEGWRGWGWGLCARLSMLTRETRPPAAMEAAATAGCILNLLEVTH